MTKVKQRICWWISAGVSSVLCIVLISLWGKMNEYIVKPTQLVEDSSINTYLNENLGSDSHIPLFEGRSAIKTGIFIQSVQLLNSTEVSLTGYVWQRYLNGIHDAIKPKSDEVGFHLPEQVNTGSDLQPLEVFRSLDGDDEVIAWYFKTILRQPFDYSNYPFDHKTIQMRIWPKNFLNTFLIPDWEAYSVASFKDVHSMEKDIVLSEWEQKNTYFDYQLSHYDVNFSTGNYIKPIGIPELNFNLVIKRKFETAFIAYIAPLLFVASLLFLALLTVSKKENRPSKLSLNTTGFIGFTLVLFVAVMLAHIQLREGFSGTGIVYIEYFYLLMYCMIVLIAANAYLFYNGESSRFSVIFYNDNLFPKVAYWPLIFGSLNLITFFIEN